MARCSLKFCPSFLCCAYLKRKLMTMIEPLVLMTLASCLMTSESVSWPGGTYGIPKPKAGCPSADGFEWQQGWRSQDSDGNENAENTNSIFHVDAVVDGKMVNRSFCIKTEAATNAGNMAWPPGQYCIYKRDRCPSGLKEGFVRWDDDDVDGSSLNKNDKGGTLPEGIYDQNTKINFCCRTDGRKSHPVLLPTRDPFLLLAYGSEKCQMVKGTVATQEWIHYRTETSSNADKSNGAIPYRGGQRHPTIHYCYYQGCSTDLTGVNGTFNSTIHRTEEPVVLYCSWRITVPPTLRILLTFTNFSLRNAAENDSLHVYDGRDTTREELGVFCGGRPPPKKGLGINSSSNHLFVVFKSSNHTKYTGFVASYFGIQSSVSPTSASSSSASSNPTSHTRAQATHNGTQRFTQKKSKESQQTRNSRSAVIIYGPVIGVLVVALIALLFYVVWIRKRQRNYRVNETLTLGCYVKKAVNIDPPKSQTENYLDITETSFGRSEETDISDNSSLTRPQVSEISFTHEDFRNKSSLEKQSSTLDCSNGSLKGLSISLEGEINVKVAFKVSQDKV
ncbi:uncharacterized protein LOC141865538 isoform X2 [Acropora palmata]|uniref:uncharacterized protein LOC141865538 isoform X2 n=1 Tax=Acropora palmata TaxID=6131 RepID=UPI003DA17471